MKNPPLLEFRDTTVDYWTERGWIPAVRLANLHVAAGETLGLAGESGSGKSTLAMSALRLLPRSARMGGQVLLSGEDVMRMSFGRLRAVRWAKVSIVFQGALESLNPVRRVGQQIAAPIRLHRNPPPSRHELRRRVAELLAQVELPVEQARAYPHELSGGQRQRVLIAMAMACEPSLLIADEPTTALDLVVQAQVLNRLTTLVRERGIGLMMISHDLPLLSNLCQRIAVMYRGELVEIGAATHIMQTPAHPHTRRLAAGLLTIGDPACRRTYRLNPRLAMAGRPDRQTSADGTSGRFPVLEASRLTVSFRRRDGRELAAVDGVDVAFEAAQIVALVGQSGSGKTTLARALLGLQRPTSGQIRFHGQPLPVTSRGLRCYRRHVQWIPQDPTSALNARYRVYDAVAEGVRIHRLPGDERTLVADALSKAELQPPERFFPALPHELSAGERQRVVIAGALALRPTFLIADEPVASLDAAVRGEILALMLRLRTELGLGALLITHDLAMAWSIADRVIVMRHGRVVEHGLVEQVLLDPQHQYTKLLLSASRTTVVA
jgi:peptide/nickel transport system ATP-binding protein